MRRRTQTVSQVVVELILRWARAVVAADGIDAFARTSAIIHRTLVDICMLTAMAAILTLRIVD